jgi:simple sugar transport system ATP-binding protein
MEPLLQLSGIGKAFGPNRVLRDVEFAIAPGEILCLVGENGAGKSTLMNILFGMAVVGETGGYEGTIRWEGRVVQPANPEEAMALGIGMVHQEFMLIPGFTVHENVKLNREPLRPNAISRIVSRSLATLDRARMRRDAREALDRMRIDLDVEEPAASLPVGLKQFVEIAREIDKRDLRLLIVDEPTAVLTESEAANLLLILRDLSRSGIAILFITHRLEEVVDIGDSILVLRDGEVVGRFARGEATAQLLAERMVGRSLNLSAQARRLAYEEATILSVQDLVVDMPGEEVRGVSLDIRRGEIFGLAGLAGHGKVGIANGILGLHPATGTVLFEGAPLPTGDTAAVLAQGIAFLSEDRRGVGLMLEESVERNIALTAVEVRRLFLRPGPIGNLRLLDASAVRAHAERMIRDLDIRCRGPEEPVSRLSGGNQQKVCIARAMTLEPRLLFVNEPTRGIDVGAKKLILDRLFELNRRDGVTIVLTSSELAELRSLADRIGVVYRGRLEAVLPPDASDADFGLAMAGELHAARDAKNPAREPKR